MNQPTETRQSSQENIDFAVDLLNRAESVESVHGKLVERRLSEEVAASLLNELFLQAVYNDAVGLLNQGHSPDGVKKILTEKGLKESVAVFVVDDILARHRSAQKKGEAARFLRSFFGAVVFGVGMLLFLGNITGAFPSFPFAGFIVMSIGGAIWGAAETG